jgi:hypothetical protein
MSSRVSSDAPHCRNRVRFFKKLFNWKGNNRSAEADPTSSSVGAQSLYFLDTLRMTNSLRARFLHSLLR